MKIVLLFAFFALTAPVFGECLPVTGDRILGRDLALAEPSFSGLPAAFTIGYAPTPGTRRIFAASELARIARANGIELANPAEVCFEIPTHEVSERDAVEAMRRALPPTAELAIVELPKLDLPLGELNFPLAGLEPPNATQGGVQLWRGFVKYAGTRRAAVWARVTVSHKLSVVVVTRDLVPNSSIDASAVRLETRTGPLVREQVALRLEDVLGRVPKRAVKAGSMVPLDLLAQAPSIRKGQSVRVEVQSGPARLLFDAVAEKEARDGDLVELRNPSTGKLFHGRVDGSKAVLVVGGVPEL